MYKVNLNWNIKDFENKDIKDANAGKMVAQMLVTANKGNSIKMLEWALGFHKTGQVEMDSTDLEVLKVLVESTENLTIMVKGQIGKYLLNLTNETSTKKPIKSN